MRRLDEEIGDLDAFIKDTESMIVSELEEDILDCESELRSTFGALAELDCILSFASCAADLNFVRPEIVNSDINGANSGIFIENGRHPLQELIVDNEFIPNDTHIDQSRRINVVTGPNFSGKSCYTRQVSTEYICDNGYGLEKPDFYLHNPLLIAGWYVGLHEPYWQLHSM